MSPLRSGRYLGARLSRQDSRDHAFVPKLAFSRMPSRPHRIDWLSRLPPAFYQGSIGSCVANACNALMTFYDPSMTEFSRLQTYYNARAIERTEEEDAGAQIRDALKSLQKWGAAPETDWPYDTSKFRDAPPIEAIVGGGLNRLGSYGRLQSRDAMLDRLAFEGPFVLSFLVPDYFDTDVLEKRGILWNTMYSDNIVGAHAVLAVGYETDFYNHPDFKAANMLPGQCDSIMLLCRNSWGRLWGVKEGHFWMPINYAVDPKFGNDAWSAQRGVSGGWALDRNVITGQYL